ncbi:glycosyltransferase [Marinobacter sp. C2H3]|uniref:glycosyltransferase n=1 Tax=Marinobacter sp. C2H3 TaxID=3119003 RepID=UPI00300E7C71
MKPYVSVVIPAHNEEQHISACLSSLLNQSYGADNYEVLVVDNGSNDNTYAIATRYNVKIFSRPGIKVGAVRNAGAEEAKGDVLVFIDADCVARPDFLETGVNELMLAENLVIGGGCNLPANANWIERLWLLGTEGQNKPRHLIGACILIRKNHFQHVGGFDENLTSAEDSDFHNKLSEEGISIKIDTKHNVVHLGNAKTVTQFIARQRWHAENYLRRPRKSLKDPIFWITNIYLIALLIAIISISSDVALSAASFFVVILAAFTLTLKRIRRAETRISVYKDEIFKLFILDHLYLIGRSLGLLTGLKSLFNFKV